jgi:uncharacterized protein
MDNINNNVPISEKRNPWVSFFSLFFIVIAGLIFGQLLGQTLAKMIFGIDLAPLIQDMDALRATPEALYPLFLMQGISSVSGFILAPLFYLKTVEKKPLSVFINHSAHHYAPLLLTAGITLSFMVVNSVFVEWNLGVELPDFMAPFEQWARAHEEQLKDLTTYFTTFTGLGDFFVALIVVALIPAIGEEFLFRGLLQNQMRLIAKNAHLAIWITGLIFSVFHFQFYGLVPRMLLGVLFGYLYFWSGSLVIPMLAHFVNNGFTLLMLYLFRIGMIDYNIEEVESVPALNIFIFLAIGIILLANFKRFFEKKLKGHE